MDFIGEYQISTELCEEFIRLFESSEQTSPGSVIKNGKIVIDKSHKSSLDLEFKDIPPSIKNKYAAELDKCVKGYIKTYPEVASLAYFEMAGFQIQRYGVGDGFPKWHHERGVNNLSYYRCLAFMTYLNTVDVGGTTEFKYQSKTVSPVQGKTLVWPSDWTHTHKGNGPDVGYKYILTGWFVNFLEE